MFPNKQLDEVDREISAFNNVILNNSIVYIGNERIFDQLNKFVIAENGKKILLIDGAAGSGKVSV